jgi:group I intron endonuclease
VYLVTNKVNGKQYVGYTNTIPERRWSAHKTSARRGSQLWFHQALRKYGEDAFEWRVVSVHYEDADAKRAERAMISGLPRTYNMTPGGDGCGPLKEGHKANISRALKGNPKVVAARRAAIGCGVGRRRASEKLRESVGRALEARWSRDQERTKAAETTMRTWQDPDVRKRRVDGLRAAAAKANYAERGAKISATKRMKRVKKAVLAWEMSLWR